VRLKVGKHSIFWGDVVFNANHSVAYSQMPGDTRKQLSSPGIEAKETVLPVAQISGQIQLADTLSLAGQYFLDWKPNRNPEGGTYYGAADFLFDGPDHFSLAPGFAVPRAEAVEPDKKRGNWGINLKWSPEWLDGTLGVYYREFERAPALVDAADRRQAGRLLPPELSAWHETGRSRAEQEHRRCRGGDGSLQAHEHGVRQRRRHEREQHRHRSGDARGRPRRLLPRLRQRHGARQPRRAACRSRWWAKSSRATGNASPPTPISSRPKAMAAAAPTTPGSRA
jgi:hypothetical protein